MKHPLLGKRNRGFLRTTVLNGGSPKAIGQPHNPFMTKGFVHVGVSSASDHE